MFSSLRCHVRRNLPFWLLLAGLPAAAATPLPQTPAPVRALLSVQPFTLENGFIYEWSAERPLVTEGLLLVLNVDPAFLRPRETQEPVLFVGPFPAQRLSWNLETGRMIVLVPARVDLSQEPVWFGTPGLPEEIDLKTAQAERRSALSAGIRPWDREAVKRASPAPGEEARYHSRIELLLAATAL